MSASRQESSTAYWPAFLVAIAGAAMLVYWAQTARPLWVDEEMLALNARDRTFARFGGPLWLDQSAPLGWLVLERLALRAFGTSELAARSVTTLFGIGMFATAAWIGRRWMTPIGALVLTLLCALGEWLVFFVLELKHYSADAFGTLLMIAVACWTLDDGADPSRERGRRDERASLTSRRALTWWTVAAVALWFSNGALFVTPGIAAALAATYAWRRDWTAVARTIGGGIVIWLPSLALAYRLLLRHTLDNAYLGNYWAFAFPPVDGGAMGAVCWMAGLLQPFALKPAGTTLWMPLWIAVVAGIAYAILTGRAIGWILATVPLSAVGLALLRIVPPFERLAVWVVPPVYVAVALCADAAVRHASRRRPHQVMAWALSLGLAIAAGVTCVNVVQRGFRALQVRPRSNYGLDDRRSVRWLLATLRPGDVVLTTHFGLAGIWWYGGVDVSDAGRVGRLSGDVPLFEIGHDPAGPGCGRREDELSAALNGRSRAVVYLGFRLNVLPSGFDRLVLDDLGRRGDLVGYQRYAEESRVAVFDLARVPSQKLVIPGESDDDAANLSRAATGCLTVTPAVRW